MRKMLVPLIAAVSALTFAAPASAQWVPPIYHDAPYNFGYGFSGIRFARVMEARVARIRADIRAMEVRRILSWREARALDRQAIALQRQIVRVSRFRVTVGEARGIENGIRRLEHRVAREATDWNHRPGRYRRF